MATQTTAVYRLDRAERIWEGRITQAVPLKTLIYMGGHRFEAWLIPVDKGGDQRTTEFFSSLRKNKPTIIQEASNGVVVVGNGHRVGLFRPPVASDVITTIASLPNVFAVDAWPQEKYPISRVQFTPRREDMVKQYIGGAVNDVKWVEQKEEFSVETFRGVLSTIWDVITIDITGELEPSRECTECGKEIRGADLVAHYISEHFNARDFFKPMPGLGSGHICPVCNEKGITPDQFVPHLAQMHEEATIDRITGTFPRSAALFAAAAAPTQVQAPLGTGPFLPSIPDGPYPGSDAEVLFWARLRRVERRLGHIAIGPGGVADAIRRLAELDESLLEFN